MRSHQLAEEFRKAADFLLSKPDLPLGWRDEYEPGLHVYFSTQKERFFETARVLGSGNKEYRDDIFTFRPDGAPFIHLDIERSSVCRKVQEEKWECEPLLSNEETAQIAVATPGEAKELLPVTPVPGSDIPY